MDSTADLVPEIKVRVYTVPLTVHFGQEEYIDGVTIDKHRFYERLVESDELPTTSQASPAAFDAIFSDVASVGDSAVVVTLASKFSGTYQSACIAAAEYDNIYVVDSKSAAIGSGILAEYALECADKGMNAKTIAETLEKKRDEICLIALLDTLEYLKKGGRISKTVAFAGGLLNIKPVITVVDGEIQVIGTSGTVTVLGAIQLNLQHYNRSAVDGISITAQDMKHAVSKIRRMGDDGRKKHPCIGPQKADLTIAGCAIIEAICSFWPVKDVTVADRGIREGILLDMMHNRKKTRRGFMRRNKNKRIIKDEKNSSGSH